MTTPFEVLFSVAVYRDGSITVGGRPSKGTLRSALPDVLRTIALAIEEGGVMFNEEGEEVD